MFPAVPFAPILIETRSPVVVADAVGDQSRLRRLPEVILLAVEVIDATLPEVWLEAVMDANLPVVKVDDARYNPVPVVSALALNANAEAVVPVVATEDVKDCDPVPDMKFREVAPVLFPAVMMRLIASVPRLILPVVILPRFKVFNAVVPIVPAPVLKLSEPETEAAPATSSIAVGREVPIPTSPLFFTTNFVAPDLEAVNRSPTPLLSTVRIALPVVPEKEATFWV